MLLYDGFMIFHKLLRCHCTSEFWMLLRARQFYRNCSVFMWRVVRSGKNQWIRTALLSFFNGCWWLCMTRLGFHKIYQNFCLHPTTTVMQKKVILLLQFIRCNIKKIGFVNTTLSCIFVIQLTVWMMHSKWEKHKNKNARKQTRLWRKPTNGEIERNAFRQAVSSWCTLHMYILYICRIRLNQKMMGIEVPTVWIVLSKFCHSSKCMPQAVLIFYFRRFVYRERGNRDDLFWNWILCKHNSY